MVCVQESCHVHANIWCRSLLIVIIIFCYNFRPITDHGFPGESTVTILPHRGHVLIIDVQGVGTVFQHSQSPRHNSLQQNASLKDHDASLLAIEAYLAVELCCDHLLVNKELQSNRGN